VPGRRVGLVGRRGGRVTIKRGEAWGESGPLPEDGVVVTSDAQARAVVEAARRRGDDPPPLGLAGGDLCRTLGGRGDLGRLRTDEAVRTTVDVGSVLVDGRHHWFVAHLVARRSWWRGRVVAAMNAEWLGSWDVAPRAHPNDGLLDVLDVQLTLGDRVKARGRLPQGTHVPHPDIRQQRTKAAQFDLDPSLGVWLDGERLSERARSLSIRIEPDALTVVV
ncbi:MAG TPA: hypothetical protein VD926_08040, partial [Acidimicrobiales bacterium]|nr:hypothetical protein [Acidimicrobiales bacterium]